MVRVYDRATGKQTGAFRSGPISISGAMTWLPQGLIATGVAQDSVVRVWSDRSFELLRELPNVSWPHAMSSSSDGKYLVCSDNRRITTVWTTTDWKARTVKTTMWPKQLFARPGSHEILLNDAGNSKEQLGLLDLDTMTMKAATTGNSYIQAGFSAQGIVIAKNHSFT
jgi:WD40 repeat protein